MTKYSLNLKFDSTNPLKDVKVNATHDEDSKTITIIIEDSDIDTDAIIVSECNLKTKQCTVTKVPVMEPAE